MLIHKRWVPGKYWVTDVQYLLPTTRAYGSGDRVYDNDLIKELFPFDKYGIEEDLGEREKILLRRTARELHGDLLIDVWTKRFVFEKEGERYSHEGYEWNFTWFRFEFEEDLALLLLQIPGLVGLPPEGTIPPRFDDKMWKMTREY